MDSNIDDEINEIVEKSSQMAETGPTSGSSTDDQNVVEPLKSTAEDNIKMPSPFLDLPQLALLTVLDGLPLAALIKDISLINHQLHELVPAACARRRHLTILVGVPGDIFSPNLMVFKDQHNAKDKYGTELSKLPLFDIRHHCCGGMTLRRMKALVALFPNITTLELIANRICTCWFRGVVHIFLRSRWGETLSTLRVLVHFFEYRDLPPEAPAELAKFPLELLQYINKRTSLPNLEHLTFVTPHLLYPNDDCPPAGMYFPLLGRLKTAELCFRDTARLLLKSLELFALPNPALEYLKLGLPLDEASMATFLHYPVQFAAKFLHLRVSYLMTSHRQLTHFVYHFRQLQNFGTTTGPNGHYFLVLSHLALLHHLRHLDLRVQYPCAFYLQNSANYGRAFAKNIEEQVAAAMADSWRQFPHLPQVTSLHLDLKYRSHEEMAMYYLQAVFPQVKWLTVATEHNREQPCMACHSMEYEDLGDWEDQYPDLDRWSKCAIRSLAPIPPAVHRVHIIPDCNRSKIRCFEVSN